MIQVTRRLEFDYGHRVLGHSGKCRHLHGHRGVAEVTVKAPELDRLGMVIDFGAIKEIVGGWIDKNWDHNLLLSEDDPQMLHLEKTEERGPYVMEVNPTAENMAVELWGAVVRKLPEEIQLTHIRIWETPSCYADFDGGVAE